MTLKTRVHPPAHDVEPQSFDHLDGFDGLSERCMREHVKLYQGYVLKYNELSRKLRDFRAAGQLQPDPDAESLKADLVFLLGAIKNHELFFDILGNDDADPEGDLAAEIMAAFHSLPQFLVDLKQTALGAAGWAWTAFDLDRRDLFNYQGGTRTGIPVWNAVPILALDLSGHAYFYDFGVNKTAYIEAAMKSISWARVARRLEAAKAMK